jgi:hypothetical protein
VRREEEEEEGRAKVHKDFRNRRRRTQKQKQTEKNCLCVGVVWCDVQHFFSKKESNGWKESATKCSPASLF